MKRLEISKEDDKKLINKMHEYLGIFRKLSNYSSEELGEEIGVSRTTLVNFERNVENIRMSKAQYLALRTVLEAKALELEKYENDDSLKKAIELVFYSQNYEENKTEIKEALTTAGAVCSIKGSISIGKILAPVLPIAGIVAFGMGTAALILKGLGSQKKD